MFHAACLRVSKLEHTAIKITLAKFNTPNCWTNIRQLIEMPPDSMFLCFMFPLISHFLFQIFFLTFSRPALTNFPFVGFFFVFFILCEQLFQFYLFVLGCVHVQLWGKQIQKLWHQTCNVQLPTDNRQLHLLSLQVVELFFKIKT